MTSKNRFVSLLRGGYAPILCVSVGFFVVSTWTSCARWANFDYRTFDVAHYIQGLWQLIHGRLEVSVQHVPLLGNHVEPIILLFTPIFFLFLHPMTFVVVQNGLIASMGLVAFDICQKLGLNGRTALLLGTAILIAPAAGYIALHEFHPEALVAPFLLLMLRARIQNSLPWHWVWLVATLACKENMALLITAYCGVHIVIEHRRPVSDLLVWYFWPLFLAIVWFFVCVKLITPALNAGNIDYLTLYDRLGKSTGEILLNSITRPQLFFTALGKSVIEGNLLWGLLVPFLFLPLIRFRWVLITTPIFLQHLLSWRSSEWVIYFHYAAPILPLFWFSMAESIVKINRSALFSARLAPSLLPSLVIAACIGAQVTLGPAGEIVATAARWSSDKENRTRKQEFLRQIPANASVLAPLPYLTHLALREKLYSLHYILKGLKMLSRSAYDPPPPPEFVLIDYADSATFDPVAGYYHPAMKTVDGRIIPSSDQLLHEFLQRSLWQARSVNELTILQRSTSVPEPVSNFSNTGPIAVFGKSTVLTSISKSSSELTDKGLDIDTVWNFEDPRDVFPWMFLRLASVDRHLTIMISRGLCAPEATTGRYSEHWHITSFERVPHGHYSVDALFFDNAKRAWAEKTTQPERQASPLVPPVPLGELHIPPRRSEKPAF